ncbi:VAMP5 protein, partial [Spelaeornis formosus]|nr:VAMP5 protein [Elachura formosa]
RDPRDPPGSRSPGAGAGAGAGPPPGLSVPKGGTRPRGWRDGRRPARDFPCPGVPPTVPLCPRPHAFLSPCVPCVTPWRFRVPTCSWCPHDVPTVSPVSPRCPWFPQAGLARCQGEVEEVAELMRQNVARALEREGHLEQLQSRAQDLRQASEVFTRTTQAVTRRQRRRHRRWHLVALGLGLLLLVILALALALALARSSLGTVTSTVPTPQEGTKHPPSTAGTP